MIYATKKYSMKPHEYSMRMGFYQNKGKHTSRFGNKFPEMSRKIERFCRGANSRFGRGANLVEELKMKNEGLKI